MEKVLLARKDVAQLLGISLSFVDKLASQGHLRKVKIGSRTFFRREDVEKLMGGTEGKAQGYEAND